MASFRANASMNASSEDTPTSGILAQILLKQGELSTQMAVVIEQLKTLNASHNDHENRIRALERVRWQMAGIGAFVGLVSAFVGWLARSVHT